MMLSRRVVAALAGACATMAMVATNTAAEADHVNAHDDHYEAVSGSRLVIHIRGAAFLHHSGHGIFDNDYKDGAKHLRLFQVFRAPRSQYNGIAFFRVDRLHNRIIVKLRKNFTGEARLKYDLASIGGLKHTQFSRGNIHIRACAVSCS